MKYLIAIICSFCLFGCASVVNWASDGHPNRDRVPVEPGSRAVMITGTYADADWDGWLELPRGAGPFRRNSGVIMKDDKEIGKIVNYPNGWLIGNWFYGGVPGVIGDLAGGGAWDLQARPAPSGK
jgi:hypothetical protein